MLCAPPLPFFPYFFDYFTLWCCFNLEGTSSVEFVSEPQDVCILEGEDAYFACMYSGTNDSPRWNISGNIYSRNQLPYPYQAIESDTILVIRGVDTSMNKLTISCIVQGELTLENIDILFESKIATLTVYQTALMSSGK